MTLHSNYGALNRWNIISSLTKKPSGGSLPWCCKPHSPPCEAGAAGGAASGAALGLTSGAIAGAALATANPDAAFLNRCVLTCQWKKHCIVRLHLMIMNYWTKHKQASWILRWVVPLDGLPKLSWAVLPFRAYYEVAAAGVGAAGAWWVVWDVGGQWMAAVWRG